MGNRARLSWRGKDGVQSGGWGSELSVCRPLKVFLAEGFVL
jgi:hypothetical protein